MQRSVHVLEWLASKWGCCFHTYPMQKCASRQTSSEVGQWLPALSVFEEAMSIGKAHPGYMYHDTQLHKSRHWNARDTTSHDGPMCFSQAKQGLVWVFSVDIS